MTQNLNVLTTDQFALLSNIEKILEKLMHKRLSKFLDKNKLIYALILDGLRVLKVLKEL